MAKKSLLLLSKTEKHYDLCLLCRGSADLHFTEVWDMDSAIVY